MGVPGFPKGFKRLEDRVRSPLKTRKINIPNGKHVTHQNDRICILFKCVNMVFDLGKRPAFAGHNYDNTIPAPKRSFVVTKMVNVTMITRLFFHG